MLVRHAGTAATRAARLPLDEVAEQPLPDFARWQGRTGTVLTSPALRCHVPGATIEPQLGPWDLGRWAGLSLADVPDLPAWRTDPAYDGHGGESALALLARVAALLAGLHGREGRIVAVTHAAVIRLAVLHALGAPAEAAWQLDIAPGSLTELHVSGAGWRVARVNDRSSAG